MKKNILIILPWLPWPLNNGGNQAMFNSIKAIDGVANVYVIYIEGRKDFHIIERKQLQAIFPNITFFPCICDPIKEKGTVLLDWTLKKIESFVLRNSEELLYRKLLYLYKLKGKGRINYINSIIQKYEIEIVQCEMLSTLSLCLSLPDNVKKVFVHHELGFVRNELTFKKNTTNPIMDGYLKLLKLSEIALLNNYDKVVTLSIVDADKLKKSGVITSIEPSVAVVNTECVNTKLSEFNNILTFVGPESHAPNKKGLEWFLHNCWNEIIKLRSNYKLHIIGNWSEQTRNRLQSIYTNLFFLGFVPDLYASIKDTTMIVPITIGSGIRMKILEAACNKVPVVCTTIGVEGIPFQNGVHAFIADAPNNFIKSIISLEDMTLRNVLTQNAQTVIKEKFSLETLKNSRINMYNSL